VPGSIAGPQQFVQTANDEGRTGFAFRQDAGQPNRAGGGDAFAVGEPALGVDGARSDRANSDQVKLISQSVRKNDRIDARQLARLARADPKLLSPIRHRGEQAQRDLAVIRARAELMEARTQLINSARGLVKPLGERLKKCDADQVGAGLGASLSEGAQAAVGAAEDGGSDQRTDRQVRRTDRGDGETLPEEKLLQEVYGVGPLIALTYVLTLEEAERFEHSRTWGRIWG